MSITGSYLRYVRMGNSLSRHCMFHAIINKLLQIILDGGFLFKIVGVFGKRTVGGFRPEYAFTSRGIDSLLLSKQNYVRTSKRGVHFFGDRL
jgi:hypothetical protein